MGECWSQAWEIESFKGFLLICTKSGEKGLVKKKKGTLYMFLLYLLALYLPSSVSVGVEVMTRNYSAIAGGPYQPCTREFGR